MSERVFVSACVPSAVVTKKEVVFLVDVTAYQCESRDSHAWQVNRSLREFSTLHSKLERESKEISVVRFPRLSKKKFSSNTACHKFELYCTQLLGLKLLETSSEIQQFFGLDQMPSSVPWYLQSKNPFTFVSGTQMLQELEKATEDQLQVAIDKQEQVVKKAVGALQGAEHEHLSGDDLQALSRHVDESKLVLSALQQNLDDWKKGSESTADAPVEFKRANSWQANARRGGRQRKSFFLRKAALRTGHTQSLGGVQRGLGSRPAVSPSTTESDQGATSSSTTTTATGSAGVEAEKKENDLKEEVGKEEEKREEEKKEQAAEAKIVQKTEAEDVAVAATNEKEEVSQEQENKEEKEKASESASDASPPVFNFSVDNSSAVQKQGSSRARALFDCDGNAEALELSFAAGDCIDIVDMDDSGWWQGELVNEENVIVSVSESLTLLRGWFPSNYAEVIEGEDVEFDISDIEDLSSGSDSEGENFEEEQQQALLGVQAKNNRISKLIRFSCILPKDTSKEVKEGEGGEIGQNDLQKALAYDPAKHGSWEEYMEG